MSVPPAVAGALIVVSVSTFTAVGGTETQSPLKGVAFNCHQLKFVGNSSVGLRVGRRKAAHFSSLRLDATNDKRQNNTARLQAGVLIAADTRPLAATRY